MKFDSKAIRENTSLIILENSTLLKSIKDFFYQKLLYEFYDENIFFSNRNEITNCIKTKVKTKYLIVIEEGIFFNGHIDNDFIRRYTTDLSDYSMLGHLLDRKDRYYEAHPQHFVLNVDDWHKVGAPDFLTKSSKQLANVKRSNENYHDDYTPITIEYNNSSNITCDNLKFGGLVISEFLKNGYKIRPFNNNERHNKKFVYYEEQEQVQHLLNYEKLPENSWYYPVSTSSKSRFFDNHYSSYISVANGVESLMRIKNVYKSIKEITYYDISITSLIFTELLLKNFVSDYVSFVKNFEENYNARQWTTLHVDHIGYQQVENYKDKAIEVLPIIEQIKNEKIKVNYKYGDITRDSIIENINTDSLISLTNAFSYQHNHIRKSEWNHWMNKINTHKNNIEVLD